MASQFLQVSSFFFFSGDIMKYISFFPFWPHHTIYLVTWSITMLAIIPYQMHNLYYAYLRC